MSIKNLLPSKNRIAPPYLKFCMILSLFLSFFIFSPSLLGNSFIYSLKVPRQNSSSSVFSQEETLLFQEKLEITAGKGKSLISYLELNGGKINVPFELSLDLFNSVNRIDFIVSNQTNYSDIWTNPLWQYPDGLIIRIITRTTDFTRLLLLFNYLNTITYEHYGVNLTLYNVQPISAYEAALSLISPISVDMIGNLFNEIFLPYTNPQYGNMVLIMQDLLMSSPSFFAFGYSIQRGLLGVNKIMRGIVIGKKDMLLFSDDVFTFNISRIFGEKIIPNPLAFISKFSYQLPYYANVSKVYPKADNVASVLTGSFEWILKYSNVKKYNSFDVEIIHSPHSDSVFDYPRVMVSNSYSETLLEDEGILNMTYKAKNLGSEPAYNTTIRFHVPVDLALIVLQNLEIPVLREDLQINEGLSSSIFLNIDYFSYSYTIPIAQINGWYDNKTSLDLERWMDNTTIKLDQNTTITCTKGISSDLYDSVMARLQPILDNSIIDIISNWSYFEPLIKQELAVAVNEAYNIVLSKFYLNKTIFQFHQNNFTYVPGSFGGYLESVIPVLGVNETKEVNWFISNIPTSSDLFGAFSVSLAYSGDDQYAVFTTKESDYESLIQSYLAEKNIAGRFLSTYDPLTQTFISLGGVFTFSDLSGLDYFGITNGINLQFFDDEAVLESLLYTDQTVYRVGDVVSLTLNISNLGSIDAYNVQVDIVNLKLNFAWQPVGIIPVKSFDIDKIRVGENISKTFKINANSYIGLNAYVAIISFISDFGQEPLELINPWTAQSIQWAFSGESKNIVTSTLSFGILLPPVSLENQPRPSFPVPEITSTSQYQLTNNNSTLQMRYEIKNTGLSAANISVYRIVENNLYSIQSSNVSLESSNSIIQISPIITQKSSYKVISYANVTLNPGDKLIIEEEITDFPKDFSIPPLVINYQTPYELYQTNFESLETETQESQDLGEEKCLLRMSSANITENPQNAFGWSSFSPLIKIKISVSPHYSSISFTPLPWIYPLISTVVIAALVILLFISSKFRG
ncbi:MAG: hypothetical protein ACTSP3_10520 [Candidatus Heimdallarchaeaceae archaeon]